MSMDGTAAGAWKAGVQGYAKAGSAVQKGAEVLANDGAGLAAQAAARTTRPNPSPPDVTKQNWDGFLGKEREALSEAHGALQTFGATVALVTGLEQQLSKPFMKIPSPSMPALRIGDLDVGLPHGHMHPPNLVPPAPMLMLPSIGPVMSLPFVSGADHTLINGRPAARCGDLGGGMFCGGFVPMFEVFLGSASVWIEGMRAARTGVDITNHCVFSARKGPGDKPIGAFIGTTIQGSPDVLIGGIPMPSFTNMAMGLAFRGAGRVVKALAQTKPGRLLTKKVGEMGQKVRDAIKNAIERDAGDTMTDMAAQAGDTLPGAGVHSPTLRMDAVDLILGDFSREVRDLIRQSPTLRRQLRDLNNNGWKVASEHEPSRIDRAAKEITIRNSGGPNSEAQAISHELGHGYYREPEYVPKDGLSEEEYVRRNTDGAMMDEGRAQFNNAKARDEIRDNSGQDIGMGGTKTNEYGDVYDRYKRGEITEDQASREMGDLMRDETMGTTNQRYEDFNNDFYRDAYRQR
jgi:uncharacterized Zn-binding protein involved in type VI secretion